MATTSYMGSEIFSFRKAAGLEDLYMQPKRRPPNALQWLNSPGQKPPMTKGRWMTSSCVWCN